MTTALYQAERGGKEQETQRLAGCARFQPGGHLREECEPCCRVEQAFGGVQLSFNLYSLWHVAGGKVNASALTPPFFCGLCHNNLQDSLRVHTVEISLLQFWSCTY